MPRAVSKKGSQNQVPTKGYGIVRDKDGKPRFDDPSKVHPFQVAGLTDLEKRELNIWDGAFAVGSQGYGRLRKLSEGIYHVEEDIVAVNQVVDGTKVMIISPRMDLKKAETLQLTFR